MVPARQARLPVRQVRLRGAAQAQGGAPPGPDQGGRRLAAARPSPRTPELQRMVRENVSQVREILLQLDAAEDRPTSAPSCSASSAARRRTSASCWPRSSRPTTRTSTQRYDFFYSELAPSLELYRVRVGDVLTIKAFTRSGYVQSVNVPVYGTFQFQGLEKSTLAGALNLMDLVSFRELYGFLSGEKLAEIAGSCRRRRGAHDVSRENAEAELFGSKPDGGRGRRRAAPRSRRRPRPASRPAMRDLGESLGGKLQREEARSRVFPPERGRDRRGAERRGHPQGPEEDRRRPSRRSRRRARRTACRSRRSTGRRRPASSASSSTWRGMVLYIAILIIFMVALVIINNAMVMATLERVREIGTLRAIGAQRRFILAMLVIEAMVRRPGVRRPGRRAGRGAGRHRRQGRHPGEVRRLVLLLLGAAPAPVHRHQQRDRRVHHRAAGERASPASTPPGWRCGSRPRQAMQEDE